MVTFNRPKLNTTLNRPPTLAHRSATTTWESGGTPLMIGADAPGTGAALAATITVATPVSLVADVDVDFAALTWGAGAAGTATLTISSGNQVGLTGIATINDGAVFAGPGALSVDSYVYLQDPTATIEFNSGLEVLLSLNPLQLDNSNTLEINGASIIKSSASATADITVGSSVLAETASMIYLSGTNSIDGVGRMYVGRYFVL